jgi:hypothetical protein
MATQLVRISDLDLSTTSSSTDLIEVSVEDNTQPSGYKSRKQAISTVADNIASTITYSSLTTTSKTLTGAINGLNAQLDGVAELLAQI